MRKSNKKKWKRKMQVEWIKLKGFRNFAEAEINFNKKTLVIGANDVGKTNLLYALRILLDRTLPETEIEPQETDFHVQLDGNLFKKVEIVIKMTNITEDAVLSKLKGNVNDSGATFLKYEADFESLKYNIFNGHSEDVLEEIESRYYLKYIHFRYIQSSRDLTHFIRSEKKHLLRLSKELREDKLALQDQNNENGIQKALGKVNKAIGKLSYVSEATKVVNEELKKLSHHHSDFEVNLEARVVNFATFIDQLSLGASTQNREVGLGGDGRNNQILMALWKAKSEREHDLDNEAIIYCVEEPEAHLHPHQQRKLSKYLIEELQGQILISTHSPQITESFQPDSIIRLYEKKGVTHAASNGCSDFVKEAWKEMGYRMSILPAEAFFSDCVFLVEGPSEVLFYHALADQLKIDLDYYNISILSIDGIAFPVYVKILDALEVPWILRTDNDVFKVKRKDEWRFAGLNRALKIAGEHTYDNVGKEWTPMEVHKWWIKENDCLSHKGIYLSVVDLENDLGAACEDALKAYSGKENIVDAVKYLQEKKALRMGIFLKQYKDSLRGLAADALATPLHHAVHYVEEYRMAPEDKV